MTKQSQLERLTHVQLMQKVIHLESELSLYHAEKDNKAKKYLKQIKILKRENDDLKRKVQDLLDQKEMYDQERDEFIKEFNELLLKKTTNENQISKTEMGNDHSELIKQIEAYQKENNNLLKMTDELKREAAFYKEEAERIKIKERSTSSTFNEFYLQKEVLIAKLKEMEFEKKQLEHSLSANLAEIEKMTQVNKKLQLERKKKNEILDEVTNQKNQLVQELDQIKENHEQLQRKNTSNEQKITDIKVEMKAAVESANGLKATLENTETKLMELEKSKAEFQNRLEALTAENSALKMENKQFIQEKAELLRKISVLEEENTSSHDKISTLTEQRRDEEKRMDKMTANLNEVFEETKKLVSMTSSLKHKLEAKALEHAQLKGENQILMEQVLRLKEHYEKFEPRNKELESNIEELKTDFLLAKQSLSLLDQLESENRQLKRELKLSDQLLSEVNITRDKIAEFEQKTGDLENLIEQMKTKIANLESKLEEKENFIEQLIQPFSQNHDYLQPSAEEIQQILSTFKEPGQSQNRYEPQLSQQHADWFQRIMLQQQCSNQPTSQTKNPNSAPTDFFTLKRKTKQPSVPPSFHSVQREPK